VAGGGRIVTQDNREELPPAEYVLLMRRRTISPEDTARGLIRFDTGCTKIVEGFASLYRSATDQSPEPFGGTVSYQAGVLELTQSTGGAATQFAAGNVMHLFLLGVR
jgi:hypothetical protein